MTGPGKAYGQRIDERTGRQEPSITLNLGPAGFLACVVMAGVYGAATVNRRILFVQAVPAAVTLAVVLLANAAA